MPILRTTYFRRARDLFCRLPVRSNTRSTASMTGSKRSAGTNDSSACAFSGDVDRPPATRISKPRSPAAPSLAKMATSLIAPCAQSSWPQLSAILNLRGSACEIGLRRKCRVTARPYGVTSNGAPAHTPASAQAVTLRTVLPHASFVVRPTSSKRRMASAARASCTKWSWMFCRVVTWPQPRENSSVTSATHSSCAAESTPCGILMRSMLTFGCRCP